MTKPSTPNFAKLELLKRAETVVDEYAAENRVPDLQYPGKGKEPGEVVPITTKKATLADITAEDTKAKHAAASKPAPARKSKKTNEEADHEPPTRRLTLDLPTYLFNAINQRGFDQGGCSKYIVMLALQNDNFHIEPEDLLKDARRRKREVRHAA